MRGPRVADEDDDFSFRTVKLQDDNKVVGWYWLPGTAENELLIGPFGTEEEAIEDARRTLSSGAVHNGTRTLQ
jgi:hypothetical protein